MPPLSCFQRRGVLLGVGLVKLRKYCCKEGIKIKEAISFVRLYRFKKKVKILFKKI